MERIICLVIGYVCGLFQTGYIIGKLHKTDIREHGSGNAGTTNAFRTFGKKGGSAYTSGRLPEVCACHCDRENDLWELHERYSPASDALCCSGLYSGT